MKIVRYIAVFIGGSIACYLFISLGVVDAIDGIPGTQTEPVLSLPTYLSFVAVMMTTVTVVLAALAIGVGVVAAYTFKEIKAEAKATVASTASEILKRELSDDAIKERIDKITYRLGAKNNLDELEQGFEDNESGEGYRIP